MEISIGDKVRFLNDVGGGIVVKIVSKNQAIVRDNDGFEYPYPPNELVVIEKAQAVDKSNPKIEPSNNDHQLLRNEAGKKDIVLSDYKNDNSTEIFFSFIRIYDSYRM